MRSKLRWLHLSDVHFREKTSLSQETVFTRIREEVTERAKMAWTPDLVLLTGDLAWDANEDDFRQLKANLLALAGDLGLSRNRFHFCAGNHDSNIRKATVLLAGFLATSDSADAAHKFVASDEFAGLSARQAAYGDSSGHSTRRHATNPRSAQSAHVSPIEILKPLIPPEPSTPAL